MVLNYRGWITTAFLAMIVPIVASAGAISGGGGKSIVCRDANDVITRAESLDLYEGSAMFGLNIQRSKAPMAEQVEAAIQVIPASSRLYVNYYAKIVMRGMRLTPPGTQLKEIDDSFEVMLPKGCAAEQLANYYNDNLILVNSDIWNAMGESDRAALVLHEAVYAANRTLNGATESRRSRHVVGSLFDPGTKWTPIDDQVPKGRVSCASPTENLFFWAYKIPSDLWRLQFVILGHSQLLSKTWIDAQSIYINFDEAKDMKPIRGEDKIGQRLDMAFQTKSDFESEDTIMLSIVWESLTDAQDKVIKGFQIKRYYLTWFSGTYPKMESSRMALNCSIEIP